jgi:hypothetical protein
MGAATPKFPKKQEPKVLGIRLERNNSSLGEAPLEPGDGQADVASTVQDGRITLVGGEPVFSSLKDLPGQELEFGLVPIAEGEPVPLGSVSPHG